MKDNKRILYYLERIEELDTKKWWYLKRIIMLMNEDKRL